MQFCLERPRTCYGHIAASSKLKRAARSPVQHKTGPRRVQAYTSSIADPSGTGVVDFYEILGVDDDVSQEGIKTAYRQAAKFCHPDVNDAGHELCILLNEAYSTLSNPVSRLRYNAQLEQALQDHEDDYSGQPLSKWLVGHKMGKNVDPDESRAVFVDECACIGCKMCVWCASGTFRIDAQHGRSRVYAQWVDNEDKIEDAIASCPVDCIHWVKKEQLPSLEYVMRNKVQVTDVGTMMGGAGHVSDVFAAATQFLKKRDKDLKDRQWQVRQHSPVQEEARQRAADELVKQQYSWLGPLAGMFARNMQQGSSSVHSEEGLGRNQVGQRRRAPAAAAAVRAQQQATIPVERSLVVISKRDM
ncbi:hypothetical protein ABBQ38_002261 [Trebouxia sp. C0009 RCD-2024]